MTEKTKVILHEYLYFEFRRTCTRCTNYWRKKVLPAYCHVKVPHGDLGVQDPPSKIVSGKKRSKGKTVVAPNLKFSHSFFNTRQRFIYFLFDFFYKQCIFSVSVPLTPLSTFMGRWIFGEILCKIFPWSQVRENTVNTQD